MKKEYNFAEMKGRKNPYGKSLKKHGTLHLGIDAEAPMHTNPKSATRKPE